MKLRRSLAFLAFLLLAACGGEATVDPADLSGDYSSTVIDNRKTGEPRSITVGLFFNNGEVTASGGCNNLTAGFDVSEQNTLLVTDIIGTMMECDTSSNADEDMLAAFLRNEPEILTTGDVLTLQSSSTYMELVRASE